MTTNKTQTNEQGFTIIELMIATIVVAVMLVIVTVSLMGIGRLYTKGINVAAAQSTIRDVADDMGQQLLTGSNLLTGGPTADGTRSYCIGAYRYTYRIGVQLSSGQHVLWRDRPGVLGSCPTVDLNLSSPTSDAGSNESGTEMMQTTGRLTQLDVVQTTVNTRKTYLITVRLALGADDLLCSPSVSGSCNPGALTMAAADFQRSDLRCKGDVGSQFCATSELVTTVGKRL